MFTRPDDLTDDAVASVLGERWGVDVDRVAYAPVGFGSHHWTATAARAEWFLTVDDLDARRRSSRDTRHDALHRLTAALSTARCLNEDGCPFVVAPVPSSSGSVVEPISRRYVLAVYPHVDGATGSWGRYESRDDRLAVIDRLVDIHRSDAPDATLVDDFDVPSRDALEAALGETTPPRDGGPFSTRARSLLVSHADAVALALDAYDGLVAAVRGRNAGLVVTHGEPHRGNMIFTSEGVAMIDWDTTLLAPPERDLWALVDEDPRSADDYTLRSGRSLDPAALRLYRLWWDLCEVSLYVAQFREPHVDSDDTRAAWTGLTEYLDPSRWADLE